MRKGKLSVLLIKKLGQKLILNFPLILLKMLIMIRTPIIVTSWYDGCNTCRVNNGNIGGCTRMMCFREDTHRCLEYNTIGH